MNDEEKSVLRRFVASPSRRRPPFFGGRKDELQFIQDEARATLELVHQNEYANGSTILLNGAPGAGKTALLHHLRDAPWPDSHGSDPIVIPIDQDELLSGQALAEAVIRRLDERTSAPFRTTAKEGARLGISHFLTAHNETGKERAPPPQSLKQLAEIAPPVEWSRTVILTVDEIQNVDDRHAAQLQALHLGEHGLPILPILAGLSNARSVLSALGLTRIDPHRQLSIGRLPETDSQQVVRQFLRRHDRTSSIPELQCVQDIATDSDHWPEHLHNGLAAIAEQLLRHEQDPSGTSLQSIRQRARERRDASYEVRITPTIRKAGQLVPLLMKDLPEKGFPLHVIIRNLANISTRIGREAPIPHGETADSLADHLISKEFLAHSRGTDDYEPSIPSLRTYMARKARYAPSTRTSANSETH